MALSWRFGSAGLDRLAALVEDADGRVDAVDIGAADRIGAVGGGDGERLVDGEAGEVGALALERQSLVAGAVVDEVAPHAVAGIAAIEPAGAVIGELLLPQAVDAALGDLAIDVVGGVLAVALDPGGAVPAGERLRA